MPDIEKNQPMIFSFRLNTTISVLAFIFQTIQVLNYFKFVFTGQIFGDGTFCNRALYLKQLHFTSDYFLLFCSLN